MGTPVSGTAGKFTIGGSVVAEILSWSLDLGMDTPEVTPQGVAWQEVLAGLRNWSGGLELNWDMTDAAQSHIQNALLDGTSGSVRFYVDGTHYYSGATVFPTSLGVKTEVSGKAALLVSFRGSGPLVYV